jgi:hypothetical protein
MLVRANADFRVKAPATMTSWAEWRHKHRRPKHRRHNRLRPRH